MIKVLYYNWTDYRSTRGGGVTVYLRNLLAALVENKEISPVFLSSGDIYSPFSSRPYIRKAKLHEDEECPVYELVNSPVPAPGSLLSHNLQGYLNISCCQVLDLLREFIIEQGGFDVMHFHNIEGLPLNVLQLKEYFPDMKIIFSLHNYFPLCPQVQLFQYSNECCCQNFRGGLECGRCRNKKISNDWFVLGMSLWFPKKSLYPVLLKPWLKFKSRLLAQKLLSPQYQLNVPQTYRDFRRLNVAFLNKYADKILAVSHRVRDIAEKYGLADELMEVAYIGTDLAEMKTIPARLSFKTKNDFTIAYLGYARAAKGFMFLLSALEKLPEKMAEGINLKIAARYVFEAVEAERLKQLQKKFHHLEIYDGYRREDLPQLLSKVDLGIVPVIWEDNLPQVAIEMAAHGVAVLSSDFGGASELSASSFFRFQGNNEQDFIKKLSFIFNNREILQDYHLKKRPLTTMLQHLQQLKKIYLQKDSINLKAM